MAHAGIGEPLQVFHLAGQIRRKFARIYLRYPGQNACALHRAHFALAIHSNDRDRGPLVRLLF